MFCWLDSFKYHQVTFGITILTLIMLALKYQGQIQKFLSGGGGGGGVQIPCPFPLDRPMNRAGPDHLVLNGFNFFLMSSVSARPEFLLMTPCLKIWGSLANLEGQNFFKFMITFCLSMRQY